MRKRASRSADRNPILAPDAFADFYSRHATEILVYFTRRVIEPEVAMDLTAETFAQALVSRKRFRGTSEAEATGWLYGIARHQLSRFIRRGVAERKALEKLGLESPALTEEEQERVVELADGARTRLAVRDALERLSSEQRDAVELRVVEELDYGVVAGRLGISEDAARARVHRGLGALAAALEAGEGT